ncbi:MAG: tRNA guanosine(34) transglycosylase Tgt [Planctomycetes bacterium]|nr:tRNA guanosine(34) transglycosylase Tgt [Planctomycetota bacterium]
MFGLQILHTDGKARLASFSTPHGEVATPVFMPVGTAGSVKGLTPDQIRSAGSQMILANTYHLMLRPGVRTVENLGGLHRIMGWDGPVLTDSGGYQVFSLAHLRKIDDDGVTFQSHVDGSLVKLTPESTIDIQQALGADVMMQLDECPPADATHDQVATAVKRSLAWARRSKRARQAQAGDTQDIRPREQALFGIQQGGIFDDLRAESAGGLVELDLDGYAVGGLSVGEGHDEMVGVLDSVDMQLPREKPRYLMGVGEPRDVLAAVARGIDMFDCVLPTRNGRNAQAFTWRGRKRLRNARWRDDGRPIDEACHCYACRNFSCGAIRHFFMAREMLGPILTTIHNLHFFTRFMAAIRVAIKRGDFHERSAQWIEAMYGQQ